MKIRCLWHSNDAKTFYSKYFQPQVDDDVKAFFPKDLICSECFVVTVLNG